MRKPPKIKTEETQETPLLPLGACLAKTRSTSDGSVFAGHSVVEHCNVVGAVAKKMIARLPEWLQSEMFPEGIELVAALHDIGKISPTFQKKIYSALSSDCSGVFDVSSFDAVNVDAERQWDGHAGVSQLSLKAADVAGYIPYIAGQHHGFAPNTGIYNALSSVLGGQAWQDMRLDAMRHVCASEEIVLPGIDNPLQARVVAGLTSVSDWIASGKLHDSPYSVALDRVDAVLDEIGIVPPRIKPGLSFEDVFGFTPRQAQVKLIELVSGQGVYVLEAPMGLGKTEAALYASYLALDRGLATGVYFALPTQLTSEKIYDRFNAFLEAVLSDDCSVKKAMLVHGASWLSQSVAMGDDGGPGGSWFAPTKRGVLAPFAVGTIDQALMAVMNVKHGFVRAYGLAGKVVILDEVHSYDSYTGALLDELVCALRQLNCTVIILSATLTESRRAELLDISPKLQDYPLITASGNDGSLCEVSVETVPDVDVVVSHQDDEGAVAEALSRAGSGQYVLWVENTVKEAQAAYKKLVARSSGLGVECGVLHSRYIKADRATNEARWVSDYAGGVDRAGLGQGRILVGTQVLEQSLDIDADYLVTRIAPTDMLLQRIGRLWRHSTTKRVGGAQREVCLLSPDLESAVADPKESFGSTSFVYSPYVLCRSLEVWRDLSRIALPSQIRDLVEQTYSERSESGDMRRHQSRLELAKSGMKGLARVGLADIGKTRPEEQAQTRHSTEETVDLLVLRSIQHDFENRRTKVTFLSGKEIWLPHNGRSLSKMDHCLVSLELHSNILSVATYHAPNPVGLSQLGWLSDYLYLGSPVSGDRCGLRVSVVATDGSLSSISGGEANDKYDLFYNSTFGYESRKK